MKKRITAIIFLLAVIVRFGYIFSTNFGVGEYEKELIVNSGSSIVCVFGTDCGLPVFSGLVKLANFFGTSAFDAVVYWGRLISAFLGIGWVWLGYRLVNRHFNSKIGLLFLLIASFSPQFVFMSRFYTPVSLSFPLFAASFYFLIKWFDNKMTKHLIFWIVLFLASIFSSLHLAISAFVVLIIFLLVKKDNQKTIPLYIVFICLFFWLIFASNNGLLSVVKIAPLFADPGVINGINSSRGIQLSLGESPVAKILFNKGYSAIYWFSVYLKQFAFNNIFSLVEPSRSSLIIDSSPMLLIFAPFYILGLIKSFKMVTQKKAALILVIFLLSAVSCSFFSLAFYQDLFLFPLVFITFYSALGLANWLKGARVVIFAFLFVVSITISYFNILNGFNRSERLPNKANYQEVVEK
jgi:hypothetical protein